MIRKPISRGVEHGVTICRSGFAWGYMPRGKKNAGACKILDPGVCGSSVRDSQKTEAAQMFIGHRERLNEVDLYHRVIFGLKRG